MTDGERAIRAEIAPTRMELNGANRRFHDYATVARSLFVAEETMPHRRRVQEGSFSAHFDELVVKHFTHSPPTPKAQEPAKPKRKRKVCVHQALFERAGH